MIVPKFYGYEMDQALVDAFQNRNGSRIALDKKNGSRYQLKIFLGAPYPNKETMSEKAYQNKMKKCDELLAFRKKINEALRKADSGDRLLGYATEVFLSTEIPNSGITEAVPFIEGGVDWTAHRSDHDWILSACTHLAEAVARLHEAGVVHTDLKPENAVFTEDARDVHATLIDFDKSCFQDQISPDTGGTEGYQAPELIRLMECEDDDEIPTLLKDIGFHTDIFALGVCILVMLTGKAPMVGRTNDGTWVVRWDRSQIREDYLMDLLDAMLSPDQSVRPDAKAVAESLQLKHFVLVTEKYSLWPEHAEDMMVNSEREAEFRRIVHETFNGEKGYTVVFSNGAVRHYSLQQMRNAFILVPKERSAPSPAKSVPPDGSDGLTPQDSAHYVVDVDTMRRLGYVRMIHTDKGYVMVKQDGSHAPGFMNPSAMEFFGIIKKRN